MNGRAAPLVVVGVPVWRGADFVGETLTSILAQESATFKVVISIDGRDEASAAACKPFLNDARVNLVVQPSRLGWVRNSAAVLAAALKQGADYACIQPQDDLLEPRYLSSLLEVAETLPQAAVVYSDIRAFGDSRSFISQTTVAGSPVDRLTSLLYLHFNAVAFRGLTRASSLRAVEPMSENPCDNFAADTVWMTRLATVGDLVRVPYLLYRKRYHSENTHGQWFRWPRDRQIAAWTRHCIDMLAEALKVTSGPDTTAMLVAAARTRLLQSGSVPMTSHIRSGKVPMMFHETMASLSAEERASVLAEFDAAVSRMVDGIARAPTGDPA